MLYYARIKSGAVPVLVAEAIAIRQALNIASDRNVDRSSIESDLQIVINGQIMNYVTDTVNLVRDFNNI